MSKHWFETVMTLVARYHEWTFVRGFFCAIFIE